MGFSVGGFGFGFSDLWVGIVVFMGLRSLGIRVRDLGNWGVAPDLGGRVWEFEAEMGA